MSGITRGPAIGGATSAGASCLVSFPSCVPGQLAVLGVSAGPGLVVSPPPGWTTENDSDGVYNVGCFSRVLTSGDIASGSTFSAVGATTITAKGYAYAGAEAVDLGTVQVGVNTLGSTITMPAIEPQAAGEWLIGVGFSIIVSGGSPTTVGGTVALATLVEAGNYSSGAFFYNVKFCDSNGPVPLESIVETWSNGTDYLALELVIACIIPSITPGFFTFF